MIYLNAALSQQFAPAQLPGAVRAAIGKPLRRASGLTQLALVGALASLPAECRDLPTALLWQSTSGLRQETLTLLDEVCNGTAEPMPYDFLATQPAIAAAQLQAFLPGLQSATQTPLEQAGTANWSLLLSLAGLWLAEGRYAQVLCAHLDCTPEAAHGHWLLLGATPLEKAPARLQIGTSPQPDAVPDRPDFPARLADWLHQASPPTLSLHSPAAPRLALEFARL
ncbi:hypothetical protein AT959_15540 [Dechloromonas denitrificans]|uniref:Uncharacterized protein n=1 Tax=Dechloromonas denitrificans TaxID=281362 RepID=A0A133XEL7_9RHOO|nr:hypothetical protein [Dechloromonas denitrificans]KXB29378.1 hypothetical protein AT959_15540 [Dechloromonas denitrificans]